MTEGELTRYHLLLEHTSRHTPRRVNLLPCALTCAHGFAYCDFQQSGSGMYFTRRTLSPFTDRGLSEAADTVTSFRHCH